MKRFVALVCLFGFAAMANGEVPEGIDPLFFLAGLSIVGADLDYIKPPQCESFFKAAGERKVAEMYLEAGEAWRRANPGSTSAFQYYESGNRYVIECAPLSKAVASFYAPPKQFEVPNVEYIEQDSVHRLSYLAGVYARCFRDGNFHGRPSSALRATALILLAEGCEVVDLRYVGGVPNTMHFGFKTSQKVKALFQTVDDWRPASAQWKYVEWKAK